MTTEEKAEKLFKNFFDLYPNQDAYWIAKKCALMCVDEIILRDKDILVRQEGTWGRFEWEQVKKEIHKL